MSDLDCIYLTTEQIQRLAAISLDALVGCQLRSTADARSTVLVDVVALDEPSQSRHFVIYEDGKWEDVT
jgi:hypothetical protein